MKQSEFKKYVEESKGLERDYLQELTRSRRAAWWVAITSAGLAVLAFSGIALLLPLKRVEPFVVRVDNATGGVDIVTVLRDAPQSYGEAVDKYFLNKYVQSRETYDFETLQLTYDTTLLFSSPDVQREFRALFEGPGARDKALGGSVRYQIKVRSITPAKDSAVVRFVRTRHAGGGTSDVDENLVATIGFEYVAAPMHEEDRLVNPLGFQVKSYRIDPETVGG